MTSTYPAKIDTLITLPLAVDLVTPVSAGVTNQLIDALIKIESELGVKPSSVYGTVRNRIDQIENAIRSGEIIGPAGGDLGGNFPNPAVVGLGGIPLSFVGLASGQFIGYNGTAFVNVSASSAAMAGDVTGSVGANTVTKISGSSPILITPPTLQWLTTTVAPTISQADNTTASATAQQLTIQAQNATGATSTGGLVTLVGGTGTSQGGSVVLQAQTGAVSNGIITNLIGFTAVLKQSLSSSDFISFGASPSATGILRLPNTNDQTPISFRNAANTADLPILGVDSANSLNIGSNNTINYKGINHIFLSSGTSTFVMVGSTGQFQFSNSASTGVGLVQNAIATASATGNPLTIQAQNASGTTSTGGNLILTSGTGTTSAGTTKLQVGGTDVVSLNKTSSDFISLGALPASTGNIRLGSASTVVIRNNANNADISVISKNTSDNLSFGAATSQVTSITGNTNVSIITNGNNAVNIAATEVVYGINTVSFFSGQTNPVFRFQPIATASATGGSFTIQGQNATGTTSTGGNLVLTSGTGTTAAGLIKLQAGGVDILSLNQTSTDFLSLGNTPATTGTIRLNDTGSINWRNHANTADIQVLAKTTSDALIVGGQSGNLVGTMQFSASSQYNFLIGSTQVFNASTAGGVKVSTSGLVYDTAVTTPFFIQNDNTTASATGQNLTIHSQNSTGATANGGSLILGSGTGTSNPGSVQLKVGSTVVGQFTSATSDFISLGITPSSTGTIRLGNASSITGRNAGNTANASLILYSASNNLNIGDQSNCNVTSIGALTQINLNVGANTVVALNSSSSDFIRFGANPATTGGIRLSNATAITSRNAANTADVNLINFTAGNNTTVGDNTSTSSLFFQSSSSFTYTIGGTSVATMNAGNFFWQAAIVNPSLTHNDLTVGNGTTLQIKAQNTTAATSTGGNILITSGTGTSTNGVVRLQVGGVDSISLATTTATITPPNFQWITSATSPTINQANNTTASATAQTLTIQAQNATGTTSTGGNLILQSGTGTTAAGTIQNKVGTTTVLQQGLASTDFISIGAITSTTGGIRLANNIAISARDSANSIDYALVFLSAGNTAVFGNNTGPTSQLGAATTVQFALSGILAFSITASEVLINTPPILSFASTLTNPLIRQKDNTTASATGQTFTIQAQNATGTTSTGGNLTLTSGTGTTAAGLIKLQVGGTDYVSLGAASTDFIKIGAIPSATGTIRFSNGFSINARTADNLSDNNIISQDTSNNLTIGSTTKNTLTIVNAQTQIQLATGGVGILTINSSALVIGGTGNLQFTNGVASATIQPQPNAVASTTGITLSILGMNKTGTTSIGGSVVIGPGTGTSQNGNILVNGDMSVGLFTQAMADANQTISVANSMANMFIATGANTAVRAITLSRLPKAGSMVFIRNNCTSFGITVQFSSGTATSTIAPGTSALVTGDGTNAVILMTGT